MGLLVETWLTDFIKTSAPAVSILLLFFWWTTTKLIPQLQKERSEAIAAFQAEMAAERVMHREALDKILAIVVQVVQTEHGGHDI